MNNKGPPWWRRWFIWWRIEDQQHELKGLLMSLAEDSEARAAALEAAVGNMTTALKAQETELLEAIAAIGVDDPRVVAAIGKIGTLTNQLNAAVAAGTDKDPTT